MGVNETGRRPGIQSLQRAFDIIEIIGERGEMGATEISRELGLAVSTVHNLCRTMAGRGYLIGSRGSYRVGPGMSVAAARWDPLSALPALVRPELGQVGRETGQFSAATVLVGGESRLLAYEPGHGPVATQAPTVYRHPLDFPTGSVLVAFSEAGLREEIIARRAGPDDRNPNDWIDELESITTTAVCVRRSDQPTGDTALAVPVWASPSAVICAIGCSAPSFFADRDLVLTMSRSLITASQRLSAQLGHPEPRLPAEDVAVDLLGL